MARLPEPSKPKKYNSWVALPLDLHRSGGREASFWYAQEDVAKALAEIEEEYGRPVEMFNVVDVGGPVVVARLKGKPARPPGLPHFLTPEEQGWPIEGEDS